MTSILSIRIATLLRNSRHQKNAKEREIPNFIDVKIENFNDVVKENDDNQKIRHIA